VVSEEENKALARHLMEAVWKQGALDVVDEMLTPDFVDHSLLPGQASSREGYKQSAAEFYAAFSFADFTIEAQIAEGDKVVTKFSTRCIQRGEFLGVPPSGEVGTYSTIRINRIVGGKITDEWSEGSLLEMLLPSFEREIRARERVEQDLRVARSIQQASLPKEVPELEGWRIAPYYQPAREVGGDFYDLFELEEGRVGVVVGDATGKGMPAALVVSAASSMLRAVAQAFHSSSPGEVLSRVNETLVARIPPNVFVTCFYAILDPHRGSLRYANAGHTLPCCKRYDEDQADELRVRGMPLGLMPGMLYEEKQTILVPGDGVLLCTDGLVEAHNPQGEMFGTPRLRGFLSERSEGGNGLSAALMEELESFTGEGWEQEDDITLLTLKRSASPS
jgi:serine phosphatase RsbU (regulator of sigma subunit)/predicted ester cyclase